MSGSAQDSVTGPIFSNLILDRLDKYIEQTLIPAYTRGNQRTYYTTLIVQAFRVRKRGDWENDSILHKQAQSIPSRDPNDPNYRRLWYVRYADDFLLGLAGPKNEAVRIKHEIAQYLSNELKLELNADKTFITNASSQKAKFLGHEVHILQEDSKHDPNGRRCINGNIGLRVPTKVIQEKCKKYMKNGKPIHRSQCTIDDAYIIVSQYQAEYRGVVQYYRMAYNLHTFSKLRYMTEVSLVKTLASKYRTTCAKIYKKYGATIKTNEGNRKVILVKRDNKLRKPLITHFGGISLKWNKWASISNNL